MQDSCFKACGQDVAYVCLNQQNAHKVGSGQQGSRAWGNHAFAAL